MQNLRLNVFSKLAMFPGLGTEQFHMINRISNGGLMHLLFFLSSLFRMEVYVQVSDQRFIETDCVSRLGPIPYDKEDVQGWPNAFALISILNYQSGVFCPSIWSTLF